MTDLSPYIRAALLADTYVTSRLSTWQGEPAVFIHDPMPADATAPFILISTDMSFTDQDFLASDLGVIVRDISVFGRKAAIGDTNDQSRVVNEIGYRLRAIFHRKNRALGNPPFHVVSIRAAGPMPAPSDDSVIGRVVSLTVRIQDGS